MAPQSSGNLVDQKTVEGKLYEKFARGKVRCNACGHRCLIFEGKRGICQVRYNQAGNLMVPDGYVAALQCDPTEKKPFFHILPGSRSLTFGMLGCDFHCSFCQNWDISQSLRDPNASTDYREATPEIVVNAGKQAGADLVVSSYNEPLITAEWAVKIFKIAKKNGIRTAFVSNGNATREVLSFIHPYTDGYKVDLKSFRQESYRTMGGKLSTVLETIERLVSMKFWVEIVTLIIPGMNDSIEELSEVARFLCSVSPDIPWHVTAFHKDYKMTGPNNTAASALVRAAEIGMNAGLKFVYAGNLPGQVQDYENTYCPSCKRLLIQRFGFKILKNEISSHGVCPSCKTKIPGIWK